MASGKQYLVLAEGKSGDPHYGKTMRGVVQLRPRPGRRGARLRARRRGDEGRSRSSHGRRRPGVRSDHGARRRRHSPAAASRRPGASCCKPLRRGGASTSRTACTSSSRTTPSSSSSPRGTGSKSADLREPPDGLNVPTGAEPRGAGDDRAHRRLGLRDREDDDGARARPRGAAPRASTRCSSRPARPGWRSRAGGSRSTRSSPTSSPARRSSSSSKGTGAAGELLWVEGQGSLSHPAYSGVTIGLIHGSAPHLFVLCHKAGTTEIEGFPGHPLLSLSELIRLHESISLPARKAKVAAVALNTAGLDDDAARAAIADGGGGDRAVADDPVRFGAGPLLVEAVLPPLDIEHMFAMMANTCSLDVAVIVGLLALAVAYSARSSISAGHEQSYVVRYGDTLWSIAASHYGGDTREAIWNLQDQEPPARHRGAPGPAFDSPVAPYTLDEVHGHGSRLLRDGRLDADGRPLAERADDPARRRSPALRLRRGDAAADAALECRARRPARGLPHPLPRRPLPRAARDAEDVRAPRARRADHDLRAAGAFANCSARCAGSSASSRTRTSSSSSPRATRSSAATTSSSPSRSRTASPRSATRSSKRTGRVGSTSRPQTSSACRTGPSAARSSAARR